MRGEIVRIDVRWMIRADMPQVLAIDFDSYVEEWGEQEFIRQLRRREVIGMVAYDLDALRADGTRKILGYMIYVLFKNRIELERLAVDVNHRRAGVVPLHCSKNSRQSYGGTTAPRFVLMSPIVCCPCICCYGNAGSVLSICWMMRTALNSTSRRSMSLY